MKLRGGYNISLAGRPSGYVELLPEPETLYLPLRSRRFTFSRTCVEEGQRVQVGHVLARDDENYSVPLLAPREGTVRLEAVEEHIVLEDVAVEHRGPPDPLKDAPHAPDEPPAVADKRDKLLELGAWQFLADAYTGCLPDPHGTPQAVIISTIHVEPFVARGDVQLHKRLSRFTRGLEHLQSLLEYQPIYLILPEIRTDFAQRVREAIRGYAWAKAIHVPRQYPSGNFTTLARALGLKRDPDSPVWAVPTAGVLAVDRALTMSRSCTVRIVALGGPAVTGPKHLKAMPGYPIASILEGRVADGPVRTIGGGALTGVTIPETQKGLAAECTGLTVLKQHHERELLGFVRPGADRRSYSRCFLSSLRGVFAEPLNTALRGEPRPCISCGYCEDVCPAGILPHLLHKFLYKGEDGLEEADQAGVDLCVDCGLCSFVCPCKIELRREFRRAKRTIAEELLAIAEEAAKAEQEAKEAAEAKAAEEAEAEDEVRE